LGERLFTGLGRCGAQSKERKSKSNTSIHS